MRKGLMLMSAMLFMFSVLVSCKKDEKSTVASSNSMTGTLSFDISQYLLIGEKITLDASGITDPEDVEYSWTGSLIGDSDGKYGNDTIVGSSIDLTVTDKSGTYTIILSAVASGYYTRQLTKDVVVVDPDESEGSLTDIEYSGKTFTDPRDGKVYQITTAGNLDWFSENLDWAGAGEPYGKSSALAYVTGRLYTWNDATGGVSSIGLANGPQGVCPEGWSIPTHQDWEDLAAALGSKEEFYSEWPGLGEKVTVNAKFNGTRVWPYSPDHTSGNMYNWAALAMGYGSNGYNNYYELFQRGFWWSATEEADGNVSCRLIYYDSPDFPFMSIDKDDFAASVRCVRKAVVK